MNKTFIFFGNNYEEYPNFNEYNITDDDNINIVVIGDIYNTHTTRFGYYSTFNRILNNKLKFRNFKFIDVKDKSIEKDYYKTEAKKIFNLIQKVAPNGHDSEMIISTKYCGNKLGYIVKLIGLWYKFWYGEIKVVIDGYDVSNYDKLDDKFSKFTEESFINSIIDIA